MNILSNPKLLSIVFSGVLSIVILSIIRGRRSLFVSEKRVDLLIPSKVASDKARADLPLPSSSESSEMRGETMFFDKQQYEEFTLWEPVEKFCSFSPNVHFEHKEKPGIAKGYRHFFNSYSSATNENRHSHFHPYQIIK